MSIRKFSPNWKYVIGEVTLIFLGISLAIGFQNWNQTRIEGQKEATVLIALKTKV